LDSRQAMRNSYFEEVVRIAAGFTLIASAIFVGTTITMDIKDYCKIREKQVQKELEVKRDKLNDLNRLIDDFVHRRKFPELR